MRPTNAMLKTLIPFAAVMLLTLSCSPSGEATKKDLDPPFKPVAGVRLLMSSVIDPQTDILWASVGTIISMEGTEEIRPETDEEWTEVRNAAIMIAESGNLLMLEGRAVDNDDWMGWSRDLIDAAEEAMVAADAHDPEAIFELGEKVYWVCSGCHENYWMAGDGLPPLKDNE